MMLRVARSALAAIPASATRRPDRAAQVDAIVHPATTINTVPNVRAAAIQNMPRAFLISAGISIAKSRSLAMRSPSNRKM